jgi:hypothetical protein
MVWDTDMGFTRAYCQDTRIWCLGREKKSSSFMAAFGISTRIVDNIECLKRDLSFGFRSLKAISDVM